jgi:TonB-linked SusC/RagA family outer membrane protein
MVSLSYLTQDGMVKGNNDKYQRYSLMFNADHKINNWIKVGNSLTFSRTALKSISENSEYYSVITSALMVDPLTPAYYKTTADIPVAMQANIAAGKKFLKNSDGQYFGVSELVSSTANPFVVRDMNFPSSQNNTLFGNVFIDIIPLKGLTLTSRLGGRIMSNRNHFYEPAFFYDNQTQNASSKVTDAMSLTTYWNLENYANYTKSVGDHHGNILVGMSSSEELLNKLKADGSPITVDNNMFDDLDYLASNPTDNTSGSVTLSRKLSYFGRLNYDFKNKYMFQFSLRRDAAGSDLLPLAHRWGTFPAASGGWVVSSENFFPKTALSYFKIRASWGQNGSLSNLGNFGYQAGLMSATITSAATIPLGYPIVETSASITNVAATAPANLSNADLKWETSEQSDFGLDLRAFKDRLTISMDYYIKKTKDLLTTGAPILETGNLATTVNAGDVENRGFEFEASYRNKIGKFNYSVSGNFATLHNEVTYMNPTMPFLTGTSVNLQTVTRFDKGHPIWYFYGYKTKGIDPETGKTIFYKKDGTESYTVGVVDKQYLGSGIPTLNYGFNIDLSYKNFDFKAFLQGASGHKILLGMVRTDRPNFNKLQVFYDNRWTPINHAGTMPSATADANTWFSDMMVFKGDYLKVKQVQLGYTVPKSIMKKIAASTARLYVSVENLHTYTKYPGADPEVGASKNSISGNNITLGDSYINSIGVDRGMYPVSMTILFGASISF